MAKVSHSTELLRGALSVTESTLHSNQELLRSTYYSVSESATRLEPFVEQSTPSSQLGTVSAVLESLPLHITYGLFAPRHSLDCSSSPPCTTNTIPFFISFLRVPSRLFSPEDEASVELAGLLGGVGSMPECNRRCTSETYSGSRAFGTDAEMCSK